MPARAAAQRTLCPLWGAHEPVRFAHHEALLSLRKEVYNSVLAHAFAPLGFTKRNRKKGVDVLYKPLTDRLAVVIDTDRPNLLRLTRDAGPDYDERPGGALTLNWLPHLGEADRRRHKPLTYLRYSRNSYASTCYDSFVDPQSLEIAIRAHALMYELTLANNEEVITTHG